MGELINDPNYEIVVSFNRDNSTYDVRIYSVITLSLFKKESKEGEILRKLDLNYQELAPSEITLIDIK